MTEREIKAWSMNIAVQFWRPKPNEPEIKLNEWIEWLTSVAKPIANEIRSTPDISLPSANEN